MDAEIEERFDRLSALVAGHFEAMHLEMDKRFSALEERMGRLEERMDRLEERMDRLEERIDRLEERIDRLEERMEVLERRVGSMDFKFTERFIGVDDRLASARLASAQFETRVMDALEAVKEDLGRLTARVTTLEENLIRLNDRVDGLADDMRQRFRNVDDRLAALVA